MRTAIFCILLTALALFIVWADRRWNPRERQSTSPIEAFTDRRLRVLECLASWYSSPEHGRPTASGEIFDSTALTCAIYRPYLRHAGGWGARLLVRNSYNGRCVLVRITDAMPSRYAIEGRMLDLSRAAACSLGMVRQGVAPVECWILTPASGREKEEKNGRS